MRLRRLAANWDALGRLDPYWAILADPAMHGGGWSSEEFFATGREHVASFLALAEAAGRRTPRRHGLDFGCGVGRLTLALADHVEEVLGVDAAASMIELAESHAAEHPSGSRVTYRVNVADDLAFLPSGSVDVILSVVVLQHMSNRLKRAYLREFVRVLSPEGVAVFTVPHGAAFSAQGLLRRILPNAVLNVVRRRIHGYDAVMEFHVMSRRRVEAVIRDAGGVVLSVHPDALAGSPWISWTFVVAPSTGGRR
jgi:2-polyprenyl-3-methyl-5-hydroxy-6-metoxy-1,4-benzoquinol methylase